MALFVVLALFTVLAILGLWLGADSRVPGGWTPTDPEGKLWPDRPETPRSPHGTGEEMNAQFLLNPRGCSAPTSCRS